jgi:hypothetical protein
MVSRWPIQIDGLPFLRMVIAMAMLNKPDGTNICPNNHPVLKVNMPYMELHGACGHMWAYGWLWVMYHIMNGNYMVITNIINGFYPHH